MTSLRIEHVNLSVRDPAATARLMQRLFDWRIRWQGAARDGGRTIHVGAGDHYLALYTNDRVAAAMADGDFAKGAPLNHVGIEVADLADAEARAVAAGLTPFSHSDYGPCRSFYLLDGDGIEYEVVAYH